MTPQEFKAWFDGFTEAFTGAPTKAQWARVKERVAEIDGKAVTERIYLDRYWPTYVPRYGYPYWSALGSGGVGINQLTTYNTAGAVGMNSLNATSDFKMPQVASFNSSQAMLELGRADAISLTN